jgi:hypothetical protein
MYNMVLYLCVLIVFSLHRESLKLILVTDPPSEVVLSQYRKLPTMQWYNVASTSSAVLSRLSLSLSSIGVAAALQSKELDMLAAFIKDWISCQRQGGVTIHL